MNICRNCGHCRRIGSPSDDIDISARLYNCENGLFSGKDWAYIRVPRECGQFESLAEVRMQRKITNKSW